MQLPPIAATTIGSFPRPSWLAATDRSRVTFRLDGAAQKKRRMMPRVSACELKNRSASIF